MLRLALLLSLWMFSVAHACEEPDEERDLWGSYERAWAATDEDRRELLARAQGAWLDYREASCEMFASRDGLPQPQAYRQCRSFMAGERMFELRLICRTSSESENCDSVP
ncbi:MAG TPA: lysozyme inhibitor LprI family protein [Burkholderiales bacterium]|jgi:uncharacterized protein YecT (DUF1311 family)|nr:lysozyme inhibitor LprI family protein [Burkholderiales bacterium]